MSINTITTYYNEVEIDVLSIGKLVTSLSPSGSTRSWDENDATIRTGLCIESFADAIGYILSDFFLYRLSVVRLYLKFSGW